MLANGAQATKRQEDMWVMELVDNYLDQWWPGLLGLFTSPEYRNDLFFHTFAWTSPKLYRAHQQT